MLLSITAINLPSQRSCPSISTQDLSNPINLCCMLRPAGVAACLPAPHPNGNTSLLLPCVSSTTSASRGNLPPPRGCKRPNRTKRLLDGVVACSKGSEKGAEGERLCVEGSWQRTKAWREGERLYRSGNAELRGVSSGVYGHWKQRTIITHSVSEHYLARITLLSTSPVGILPNCYAPSNYYPAVPQAHCWPIWRLHPLSRLLRGLLYPALLARIGSLTFSGYLRMGRVRATVLFAAVHRRLHRWQGASACG